MSRNLPRPFRPMATRSHLPLGANVLTVPAFTPCSLEAKGRSGLRRIHATAALSGPLTAEQLHLFVSNKAATPFIPCTPLVAIQEFSIPIQLIFPNTSDIHLPFPGRRTAVN